MDFLAIYHFILQFSHAKAFKMRYNRCLYNSYTVKLGNKERFDKEQIGIKELIMDYQPFYTINLLLDKELLLV